MESSPSENGKICRCFARAEAVRKQEQGPEKPLLTRAVEGFYDHCAAFNLRYVPYRTVTERVSVQTFAKDFAVLFCFAATSFVVFLTILSRIAMHLWLLCSNADEWIRRNVKKKNKVISEHEINLHLSAASYTKPPKPICCK